MDWYNKKINDGGWWIDNVEAGKLDGNGKGDEEMIVNGKIRGKVKEGGKGKEGGME